MLAFSFTFSGFSRSRIAECTSLTNHKTCFREKSPRGPENAVVCPLLLGCFRTSVLAFYLYAAFTG